MTTTTVVDIPAVLAILDENVGVCISRGYFDLDEVTHVFDKLYELGFSEPDISDPIIDWTRNRNYCDSDKFMNALLDLRLTLVDGKS